MCQHVSEQLSEAMYDFLNDNPCESFHWFCNKCNIHAVDTLKLISKMKDTQNEFESRLEKLENDMSGMDVKIKSTVRTEVNEAMDEERRRESVIVKGLAESDHDIEKVDTVLNGTLKLNVKFKGVERLGKKIPGQTRNLKVQMDNRGDWRKVLQSAKKLKFYEESRNGAITKPYEKVYIDPDLSKAQQDRSKHLREKLMEYRESQGDEIFRIRRNKIFRVNQKDEELEEMTT